MIVRTIFHRNDDEAIVYTRVSPSTWKAEVETRRLFDALASPSAEKQVKSCSPTSAAARDDSRATSSLRRTQCR